MKNKKQIIVAFISLIVIFGTILFTKPKQIVSVNLNYLSKVKDDNSALMYDLTSVYRAISTFVKYYYISNLRTSDKTSVGINIEPELGFIQEVYQSIPHLFNSTNPRKVNELLQKLKFKDLNNEFGIDQAQFQKITDYLSEFTFNISEKKLLDQRTGKILGSKVKISFSANSNIEQKDIIVICNIFEKHITEYFLSQFNEKINQIYFMAENQIYTPLIKKASDTDINYQSYSRAEKNLDVRDKFIEELFKYENLIREIKFDYDRISDIFNDYKKQDKKYTADLKLVDYNDIRIATYRGLLPETTFFIILFGLILFINIAYAFIANKKLVSKLKSIIT